MHPAFSVIFLTTLIGAGQGLFLALYTGQSYAAVNLVPMQDSDFFVIGSLIAVLLLIGGLAASFFHLGHPERAWRSAAMWRTSWLSREVIVLPMMIGGVAIYGLIHYMGWDLTLFGIHSGVPGDLSLIIGAGVSVVAFLLYLCTGMIYACIKFLQEWASPLTVINYTILGGASGFTLATVLAAMQAPALVRLFGVWAIIITLIGLLTRAASLIRNTRIKHKSTLQTAIGVRHTHITQRSQGLMGGSFNTREFFHGAGAAAFRSIKWIFLLLVFPVPATLLWLGITGNNGQLFVAAFIAQYIGLIAERWYFFAQSNHPQNLYYQTIS
jgi:DMSO reductase anchor subunit